VLSSLAAPVYTGILTLLVVLGAILSRRYFVLLLLGLAFIVRAERKDLPAIAQAIFGSLRRR
jgi:hypothetical protein